MCHCPNERGLLPRVETMWRSGEGNERGIETLRVEILGRSAALPAHRPPPPRVTPLSQSQWWASLTAISVVSRSDEKRNQGPS